MKLFDLEYKFIKYFYPIWLVYNVYEVASYIKVKVQYYMEINILPSCILETFDLEYNFITMFNGGHVTIKYMLYIIYI